MALVHGERVPTALDHKEPDRVPVDLGGNQTGTLIETNRDSNSGSAFNRSPRPGT